MEKDVQMLKGVNSLMIITFLNGEADSKNQIHPNNKQFMCHIQSLCGRTDLIRKSDSWNNKRPGSEDPRKRYGVTSGPH